MTRTHSPQLTVVCRALLALLVAAVPFACSSGTAMMDAGSDAPGGDVSEASPPSDSTPADAAMCPQIGGYYDETGMCTMASNPQGAVNPGGRYCVYQSGCTASLSFENGGLPIDLTSDSARWQFSRFDGVVMSSNLACTATPSGSDISWTCHQTILSDVMCTLTWRQVALAGTTRECNCDLKLQDCGTGRCTLVLPAGQLDTIPACVAAAGTVARGMPCTRDSQGIDNCVAGTICTTVGSGPMPVCRPVCTRQTDCAAGQDCVWVSGLAAAGACVASCTPFSSTCSATAGCTRVTSADASGATQATLDCTATAGGADGTVCSTSSDCAADTFCAPEASGPHCRAFCDSMHPCAVSSRTCRAIRNRVPGGPVGLTFCAITR